MTFASQLIASHIVCRLAAQFTAGKVAYAMLVVPRAQKPMHFFLLLVVFYLAIFPPFSPEETE